MRWICRFPHFTTYQAACIYSVGLFRFGSSKVINTIADFFRGLKEYVFVRQSSVSAKAIRSLKRTSNHVRPSWNSIKSNMKVHYLEKYYFLVSCVWQCKRSANSKYIFSLSDREQGKMKECCLKQYPKQ